MGKHKQLFTADIVNDEFTYELITFLKRSPQRLAGAVLGYAWVINSLLPFVLFHSLSGRSWPDNGV